MSFLGTRRRKTAVVTVVVAMLVVLVLVGLNAYYTAPAVVAPKGWDNNDCRGSCFAEFFSQSGGLLSGSWTSTGNTTAMLYSLNATDGPVALVWVGHWNVTLDSISYTLAPGWYQLWWQVERVQGQQGLAAILVTDALTVHPTTFWWV